MENENEFNIEMSEENGNEFREFLLELIENEPVPNIVMTNLGIVSKAYAFKTWLENEFDFETKTEVYTLGLNNELYLSFTTDAWETNLNQKSELKKHLSEIDDISVVTKLDGETEISFGYENIFIHQ